MVSAVNLFPVVSRTPDVPETLKITEKTILKKEVMHVSAFLHVQNVTPIYQLNSWIDICDKAINNCFQQCSEIDRKNKGCDRF